MTVYLEKYKLLINKQLKKQLIYNSIYLYTFHSQQVRLEYQKFCKLKFCQKFPQQLLANLFI